MIRPRHTLNRTKQRNSNLNRVSGYAFRQILEQESNRGGQHRISESASPGAIQTLATVGCRAQLRNSDQAIGDWNSAFWHLLIVRYL